MKVQAHIIFIYTTSENVFLSHYNDEGHNPQIEIISLGDKIKLQCTEIFKIKDNFQKSKKDRVDIYLSLENGRVIGQIIDKILGSNTDVDENQIDPNGYINGNRELPHISDSKKLYITH